MRHNSKLSAIVTTIQVTDLEKAIEFYNKLGFTKDWIWPDKTPTHASLSKDGVGFMITINMDQEDIQKGDLYFRISNVEGYYKYLKSQRIIDENLIQSNYGMLDFSLTDPWGHRLTFGEPKGDFEH